RTPTVRIDSAWRRHRIGQRTAASHALNFTPPLSHPARRTTAMSTPSLLFNPTSVAGFEVPHRIVMAPMTRARSTQPGDIPNAMNARYYAQRASAALIVTEATQISPQGKGYSFTPGIYSREQVAGWRLVTQAVHAAG